MKENYHDINVQISTLKGEINSKKASLGSDKVLKTLISYYSKE